MKIFHFLRKESSAPLQRLVVMAVVSGFSSVLVLAVINASVERAVQDAHSFLHLAAFLLVTAIFIVSQRYLMVETTTEVENILQVIRLRIVDKIRTCDLEPLEKIGRSQIYTSLSRDAQTISQSATFLVISLQAGVLIFFALLYLAWLSIPALLTFLIVSVLATVVQAKNSARLDQGLLRAMERENKLLDTLSHFLDGFAEVKMNPKRSDDLYEHLHRISNSTLELQVEAKKQMTRMFTFGQSMLYVLVAAMIFVVPRLSDTYNDIIVQAATAMLFLTGPISTVVSSFPAFAGTQAAINGLESLETQLDGAVRRRGGPPDAEIAPFRDIRFESIVFQFHHTRAERPFTLGPIDLTLRQGETVFIVGGNGSGKSTFLHLLTALYDPDQGLIRVNGEPVAEGNLQAYRNLFSVIFTDFHLFDRLYGLGDDEEERVAAWLAEMELSHKTSYANGEFTTLDLSTGQRKRLAYVVSLLEDRPIYVFDEWAAGQDPEFRRKFYEKLLPQLKESGKTIFAVTHDDRYWEFADRLLKMEEGRFVEL